MKPKAGMSSRGLASRFEWCAKRETDPFIQVRWLLNAADARREAEQFEEAEACYRRASALCDRLADEMSAKRNAV